MKLVKLERPIFSLLTRSIVEFRNTFNLRITSSEFATPESCNKELHDALHLEEFKELMEATTDVERLDALIDMAYVITGRIVECGIVDLGIAEKTHPEHVSWLEYIQTLVNNLCQKPRAFEHAWHLVHDSNMSKTCKRSEILDNKQYYEAQGIVLEVVQRGEDTFVLKNLYDLPKKELKAGKVIKSIGYSPVDLTGFFKDVEIRCQKS